LSPDPSQALNRRSPAILPPGLLRVHQFLELTIRFYPDPAFFRLFPRPKVLTLPESVLIRGVLDLPYRCFLSSLLLDYRIFLFIDLS